MNTTSHLFCIEGIHKTIKYRTSKATLIVQMLSANGLRWSHIFYSGYVSPYDGGRFGIYECATCWIPGAKIHAQWLHIRPCGIEHVWSLPGAWKVNHRVGSSFLRLQFKYLAKLLILDTLLESSEGHRCNLISQNLLHEFLRAWLAVGIDALARRLGYTNLMSEFAKENARCSPWLEALKPQKIRVSLRIVSSWYEFPIITHHKMNFECFLTKRGCYAGALLQRQMSS